MIADQNEWLKDRKLAPVEEITFRSADGTVIDGFLVKPVDYVAGKRYPTILRIHGGPVYQFSHEFMEDWQVLAANGFAVVAANPRGSSGRGFEFAKAIYADWGVKDTADLLAAAEHVVAMGVADPGRLGIGGHSYGGILTDQVIARDTRFKGAVSSAGVANVFGSWGADMYIREYELELGLPWRNRESYEHVSYPFFNADRISTATLFLCHELDDNVPCIGSMQMYQALKADGRANAPRDLSRRVPRPHGPELPEGPHATHARVVRALPRRGAAAVTREEIDERVVRQRLHAAAAVARHVARGDHGVDDRFLGRLHGRLEQDVERA